MAAPPNTAAPNIAIFSKHGVVTTPFLVLSTEVVAGPWVEGLDARIWAIGEVVEDGGVETLEGVDTREETVGVVAVGGEAGKWMLEI